MSIFGLFPIDSTVPHIVTIALVRRCVGNPKNSIAFFMGQAIDGIAAVATAPRHAYFHLSFNSIHSNVIFYESTTVEDIVLNQIDRQNQFYLSLEILVKHSLISFCWQSVTTFKLHRGRTNAMSYSHRRRQSSSHGHSVPSLSHEGNVQNVRIRLARSQLQDVLQQSQEMGGEHREDVPPARRVTIPRGDSAPRISRESCRGGLRTVSPRSEGSRRHFDKKFQTTLTPALKGGKYTEKKLDGDNVDKILAQISRHVKRSSNNASSSLKTIETKCSTTTCSSISSSEKSRYELIVKKIPISISPPTSPPRRRRSSIGRNSPKNDPIQELHSKLSSFVFESRSVEKVGDTLACELLGSIKCDTSLFLTLKFFYVENSDSIVYYSGIYIPMTNVYSNSKLFFGFYFFSLLPIYPIFIFYSNESSPISVYPNQECNTNDRASFSP